MVDDKIVSKSERVKLWVIIVLVVLIVLMALSPLFVISWTMVFFGSVVYLGLLAYNYLSTKIIDYDIGDAIDAVRRYKQKHSEYFSDSTKNLEIWNRHESIFAVYIISEHKTYVVNMVTKKIKEALNISVDKLRSLDEKYKFMQGVLEDEHRRALLEREMQERGLERK